MWKWWLEEMEEARLWHKLGGRAEAEIEKGTNVQAPSEPSR